MYYISHLVKEKKFRLVLYIEAEYKVAAYIVFETWHTFNPSTSSPCIYRSMITTLVRIHNFFLTE